MEDPLIELLSFGLFITPLNLYMLNKFRDFIIFAVDNLFILFFNVEDFKMVLIRFKLIVTHEAVRCVVLYTLFYVRADILEIDCFC